MEKLNSNNNSLEGEFEALRTPDHEKIALANKKQKPVVNPLYKRLHILSWIGRYDKNIAVADLIAGITIGLTIIPQSIAYASLAGLSSEYGLYSAFMGSFVYVLFGTIPQVSIGPTSLMALLTFQFTSGKPVEFVVILSFIAGVVELLMGVFKMGFIINFISTAVNAAFTTATSIIVMEAQLRSLLGIGKTAKLTDLDGIFKAIHVGDASLGLACITVLLLLRQLNSFEFNKEKKLNRFLKKAVWYVSISRNMIVVLMSSALAYVWTVKFPENPIPFKLSAEVKSAVPTFKLPPFTIERNNTTYNIVDICSELGSAIFVVPIVAVFANVAIAKAFAKEGTLDASQEMLTLGLGNIAGSFFSAMPTCGAFTRSAVSNASGVRTPMAGLYSGLMVVCAAVLLTPYFKFIPKCTLSAILITAVMFMIDFKIVLRLWKINKKDFVCWIVCFVVCVLLGVEKGLLFGTIISLIFILLQIGSPVIDAQLIVDGETEYIRISPKSDIFYTGIDQVRTKAIEACADYDHKVPRVVVDCKTFIQFDHTSAEILNLLAKELRVNNIVLILQHLDERKRKFLNVSDNIRYCDENTIKV